MTDGSRFCMIVGVLALALLAACRQGGGEERRLPRADTTTMTQPPSDPYDIAATTRCLEARGAVVGEVRPRDDRFQALRDLAQTTSVQATVDDQLVGMAFVASESDARLLADLLLVPDDTYRIVTNRNVVFMYEPTAEPALRTTVDCLRP